jgi:hypothetical protein
MSCDGEAGEKQEQAFLKFSPTIALILSRPQVRFDDPRRRRPALKMCLIWKTWIFFSLPSHSLSLSTLC